MKLVKLYLVLGEYRIVVIGGANCFEDVAPLKILEASPGAEPNRSFLEVVYIDPIASKGAAITGAL